MRRRSEDFPMSRVTFVRSRADALSLFCAQFEEVYIYIEREQTRVSRTTARANCSEREKERSLSSMMIRWNPSHTVTTGRRRRKPTALRNSRSRTPMRPPLRKGGKGGLKAAAKKGDEEEKEDAFASKSSSEDALSSLEQLGIITEAKEEEKEEAKATVVEAKDEDATTGRKTPSSAEGEGGENDAKLPVLFRMIKKGFRGPPRAGEGEKSTTNNPLNRPKYQRAEGVTKYWSPFFSPLSNIYNVPTEEPTAAERLAVLHLFFFAADFVAVKTGANMEGGFFFSNFALFADAVKTQNEWWRLPSAALADFGLEHVLATNVSLWLIGREIETLLGTTSFLAVYFLGATGGAITTLAFDDSSKLIAGSSGAVFALYGAILTYTVLNLESGWNQRGFTTRLFRIGASSIALCYIASETASDGATHVVNNWDHLGGFLSGILLAYYGLCPLFSSIQFKPGEEKNRAQRLNLEDKTLEEPFAKTSAILYGVCANLVAASVVVAFKRASGVDDF